MPRVSIIIPSYNHDKYIHEAIQSVLDQTYQDFEIIITDDGSTDDTVKEIMKFTDPRIKLFCFEKNKGSSFATSNCVSMSNGEYLAMLSSDDVYYLEKLEKQVKYLDEHPDVWAVFGQAHIINEVGNDFNNENHFYTDVFRQQNRTRYEWLNYFFYKGNCLCHPSVLAKKEVYTIISPSDHRYPQQGDLYRWIKLCLQHEIFILPEELIKFRVREGEANASGNRPDVTTRIIWEFYHILNNYLSIEDVAEFTMIFPEAKTRFGNDLESDLIPFYLAMLAFDRKSAPYQIFGMNSLFDLLQNSHIAEKLKVKYNFYYPDFINLTASKKLHIQENIATLYIDSGNGFNEEESISLPVNAKDSCLEFDLHEQNKITSLRFDPLEDFVVLKIKSIQIENKEGLHQVNPSYHSFLQKDGVLFSENADPFIVMALDNIEKPSRIKFYLEYIFFGPQAVVEITGRLLRVKEQYINNIEKSIILKDDHINSLEKQVDLKDGHIKNLEKQIADIENTIGWKFLLLYRRLRDLIFPVGSLRRRLAKRVFTFFRNR